MGRTKEIARKCTVQPARKPQISLQCPTSRVTVKIRMHQLHMIHIPVYETSSILELKQLIEKEHKIPVSNQQLFLSGKPLNNHETISSSGIFEESILKFHQSLESQNEHDNLLFNVQHSLESRLFCGSSLQCQSPKVFFTVQEAPHHITFPDHSTTQLHSFQKALSGSLENFTLSFNLYQFDILQQIEQHLIPGSKFLKFELHEIALFGDNGKVCSRSSQKTAPPVAFVVVVFPSKSQGRITVQKSDKRRVFHINDKLQWIAFLADCDHKITPLKGHFIAATFKVVQANFNYVAKPIDLGHKEELSKIQQLIADPTFCKSGTVLIFDCLQYYLPETLRIISKSPLEVLIGSDLRLFSTLKATGLIVQIRAMFRNYLDEVDDYEEFYSPSDKEAEPTHQKYYWITHDIPPCSSEGLEGDIQDIFDGWLLKHYERCSPKRGAKYIAGVCDDRPFYFTCVMLLTLPRAGHYRRHWSILRLLFLGMMKNSPEECHLAKCPRDVLLLIIQYWLGRPVYSPLKRKREKEAKRALKMSGDYKKIKRS